MRRPCAARWEELSEDEIVRVPHHPFWMGHEAPPPPKAAVDFFKRVHGDLALSEVGRRGGGGGGGANWARLPYGLERGGLSNS